MDDDFDLGFGEDLVVEVEGKLGVWVRVAGVTSRMLADALVEKLEAQGRTARVREATDAD
ncbi:MAG: hypothetical protein KC776_34470 [Myxococcales bacterium]|nr:hypothetical protein [Myxococcales bacterium]MCB9581012.1 hypothetical protein [Polyangiaceae bacterium]